MGHGMRACAVVCCWHGRTYMTQAPTNAPITGNVSVRVMLVMHYLSPNIHSLLAALLATWLLTPARRFDPRYTPNITDFSGRRYCYQNQPGAAQ